jgi:uncharacterized phage protein gp47/JayE
MPFARPTLTALRNQAVQDITTSGVPGLDGLLRNAVLRVLAWVMSGLAYSVYGYLDWIARESVPFTATDEYLSAWAALVGVYQKPATAASGFAQFTGGTNLTIPIGMPLTRQDGTPYTTTADGVIDASGAVTVPIIAEVLGAATNAGDGVAISIASPIVGINSNGVTVGPLVGGADMETQDALRSRMLFRYRTPPQGGAVGDYIDWALEVPGVTRVFVEGQGAGWGSVVVFPMFDLAQAEHGGFPQGTDGAASDETRWPIATGDQLTVAEHIFPLQPVTALVIVAAAAPLPIDVELQSLDPATPEMQAAIISSLEDMFLDLAEVGGTIYPSQLYQAILSTPGLVHFTMTQPDALVVAGSGQLPVMGALLVT